MVDWLIADWLYSMYVSLVVVEPRLSDEELSALIAHKLLRLSLKITKQTTMRCFIAATTVNQMNGVLGHDSAL